jgi:methylenetetrahydrofolate reductase (NADPH)
MNFRDFYQTGKPRYSFEIFPAKTEAGVTSLFEALRELSYFDPAFISVTYGAMGSTRDLTRDLALRVFQELKLITAFHFTCVGSGQAAIREYVEKLKSLGLNLVVALRGDAPAGGKFTPPVDGFSNANELVGFLKKINGFSMAVAGYPEGHIEAPDKKTDLLNLKRKVDAGADIVLTQLFYDNIDFFDFTARARKIGITVPIIPGIMPIVNAGQVEKITQMCGAKIPVELQKKLRENAADLQTVLQIGIDHAAAQCRELLAQGVPGIHFYTMNKSYSVKKVIEALA